MPDETVKMVLDLGASSVDTQNLTTKIVALKSEIDKIEPATENAKKGVAGMGQSMLQGGRVIQDFAQGGLGGVLNNIEGLTMALGLGTGLAGAFTILGVAALTAGPSVVRFFKGLVDGANELPKAKDELTRLNEEIKENEKQLAKLKEQQRLTNTELAEFNRLTDEGIILTKKARAEKAIDEAKAPAQKEGPAAIKRALDEFGGKSVEVELARAMIRAGIGGMAQVGGPNQAARNVIANVLAGDVPAGQFMRDVLFRGGEGRAVPEVLLGGETPTEARKREVAEGRKRNDEADRAAKDDADKRRREKKVSDDAVKEAEQEAADFHQQILDDEHNEQLQGMTEGQKFARRAGEAMAKMKAGAGPGDIPHGLDLGHIPLAESPEDIAKVLQADALKAAHEEIILLQTLMRNQGGLTRQQRATLQMLQRTAENVEAAIGQGRSALTNGFQN